MESGFRIGLLTVTLITVFSSAAPAQDNSAKRLSSIVSVAVEEYGKAFDASGKLVAQEEYDETTSFLGDAKLVAQRLKGNNAPAAQAILDSMAVAVDAKRPPQDIKALHARFNGALGVAGALYIPNASLDLSRGTILYTQNCASCHVAT